MNDSLNNILAAFSYVKISNKLKFPMKVGTLSISKFTRQQNNQNLRKVIKKSHISTQITFYLPTQYNVAYTVLNLQCCIVQFTKEIVNSQFYCKKQEFIVRCKTTNAVVLFTNKIVSCCFLQNSQNPHRNIYA